MTKSTRDALLMLVIVVLSLGGLWVLFNLRLDDAPPTAAPSSSADAAGSS